MKKLIFIMGVMAAGKTTYGRKLAEQMGAKFVSMDAVCQEISNKIGVSTESILNILFDEKQVPAHIKAVLETNNINLMKEHIIKEITADYDTVVFEGCTLNKQKERDLIVQITGVTRLAQLVIIPLYEHWIQYMNKKEGHLVDIQDWGEWRKVYLKQIAQIEFPNFFYLFEDGSRILTEHNEYQRQGYTDEKFKLLHLENDVKDMRVLDLGCNAGWIGKFCRNLGCLDYLGLDFNWQYLEDALDLGVHVAIFDLNDFDKWRERYDVVLCLAAIHYVKDKKSFIENVSRITKRMFVLEVPVYNGGDTHLPTQGEIETWLKDNFKEVVMTGSSISPSPQSEYSKRLIYKAYK